MRINSADIDALVDALEDWWKDGFYEIGYDKHAPSFKHEDLDFFADQFDIAVYNVEQPDRDRASLFVVLEVLQVIQEKAKVLNDNWSLPIDLEQISLNFALGKQYKYIAMEIEHVKEEELSPLAKTFKYTGMGKASNEELKEKVAEGKDTFSIGFTQDFKEGAAAVNVNCTKSGDNKYYADTYDITVKQEGKPDLKRTYKFRGRIPVPNGTDKPDKINPTITLKEAFNQMQGRGVHKTFVTVDIKEPKNNRKYDAWEYIDFGKTDNRENYKTEKFFDLDVDKKLKSISLVDNMDQDNFNKLSQSLKRGNIQEAKYIKLDGSQESIYLEANARFNTINAYDKEMKPISLHEKRQQEIADLEQKKQGETQKEDHSQGQAQDKNQVQADDKTKDQKEGKQQDQAGEKKTSGRRVRSS